MNDTARLVIILAGVMFVTTVAGMVTLVVTGNDGSSIERIAGPLLTAMIVTGVLGATTKRQEDRLDTQDKQLRKIREQTNGVLDARIKEQTKAALIELAEEEQAQYRRSGSLSDG